MSGADRMPALLSAVAWRQRWRLEEAMRRWLWPDRFGFEPRRLPAVDVAAPPSAGLAGATNGTTIDQGRSSRRRALLGDVGGSMSVVAECARLAGIEVAATAPNGLPLLSRRATQERWGVLAVPGCYLKHTSVNAVAAFLAEGGTLLVTGLEPHHSGSLKRLSESLGVSMPTCSRLPESIGVGIRFSAEERALTQELAGIWFGSDEVRSRLVTPEHGDLAWAEKGARRWPVAWAREVGKGSIVLTTGASQLAERSAAKWDHPLSMLVPLMVLRAAYGASAWHAPWRLANFTIDDPTLNCGLLGLEYSTMVRLAREHDFHVTVATIPRELRLADSQVLQLLQEERGRVSACYHGNDHDSYEFYLESAPRHRFRSRPLAVQQRKLAEAAERGSRLAARTGYALDRVMVFPHGLCTASLVPQLHERGFLATCNGVDRYPLGDSEPAGRDVGALPADLDWSGFPLLGRRPLGALGELALDLFLGKPVVAFTHRRDVGPGLSRLTEQAARINQLSDGAVRWCGLEDVARHAYLVKRTEARWDVLMTANEICLHNPDADPRVYRVFRPQLRSGDRLRVRPATNALHTAKSVVDVSVAPGTTVEVDVCRPWGSGSLPRRSPGGCCTLSD